MEDLRRSLENADRLTRHKSEEIKRLQILVEDTRKAFTNELISASNDEKKIESQLEIANQGISERDAKIERLESELASRAGENSENPVPAIELPEPADLLNQLKARRKRSKTDLADVEAILEILGDCSDE